MTLSRLLHYFQVLIVCTARVRWQEDYKRLLRITEKLPECPRRDRLQNALRSAQTKPRHFGDSLEAFEQRLKKAVSQQETVSVERPAVPDPRAGVNSRPKSSVS